MPGVPAVLLDQVAQEPPEVGPAAVVIGGVDQLVEPAVGEGRVGPRPGPFDGLVPEPIELFGVSVAAELNSQSGSASQSIPAQGLLGGSPASLVPK